MHETHLLKNIFKYLAEEEENSFKKIKKFYVSLSEFGGISREHFIEHYKEASGGTRWKDVEVEIERVPYGPELEITRVEFR
jgi:Zn finger protein HypA/HybF involved in hydrogenase expression